MSKLTVQDAKRILDQINAGEWIPDTRREWSHCPQSGKVYTLKRNEVQLWVSSGLLHLRVEAGVGDNFIEIPFHLKVYLWFFGVGDFVASEVKRFNKNDADRDYKYLSERMK